MNPHELEVADPGLILLAAAYEYEQMQSDSKTFEADYQRSLEGNAQSACKNLLALLENAPAKAAEPFRRELDRLGVRASVKRCVNKFRRPF